jgi:CheY-like chemotaxis protein
MLRFIRPNTRMDTILLVDDNPLRASMRKSLLEGVMPSVARALDAAEALCMVETPEFSRSLALVITGHVTPGISGPEFVAEFRRRMPLVPVLVLGVTEHFQNEYQGIKGVYFSRTRVPDELRALAARIVRMDEKQTA